MGRKTRQQHIRAQTLEVARQKKAKDLRDRQIELEGEAESEGSTTDTDLDKIIDCSIPTPIDVKIFASRLREAQCLAVKMRKGEGKRKTPRTYLGNSKKTQYRREKARKVLASKGFLSVASFMALKG